MDIFDKLFQEMGDLNPNNVQLRVVMSRDLFREIRTAVMARLLSNGGATGLADSFLARFVEKVDAGETVWNVQKKT